MRGDSCQNVDAPVKMKAFSTVGLTSDHWFEHLIHVNHACTLDVSVFSRDRWFPGGAKINQNFSIFEVTHTHNQQLVGGIPTPLKNISQLG